MLVLFDRQNITGDVPGVILLSHGPMAVSTAESLFLLMGEQENLAAFGLEVEDDLDAYTDAVMDAWHAFGDNAVFLVDLFGGTPCNRLSMKALEQGLTVYALSGLNLPMVLEACSSRDECSGQELLDLIADSARNGVVDIMSRLKGPAH